MFCCWRRPRHLLRWYGCDWLSIILDATMCPLLMIWGVILLCDRENRGLKSLNVNIPLLHFCLLIVLTRYYHPPLWHVQSYFFGFGSSIYLCLLFGNWSWRIIFGLSHIHTRRWQCTTIGLCLLMKSCILLVFRSTNDWEVIVAVIVTTKKSLRKH